MSFQQGLSGLNASSKALDTIGNNIANSGTVGYKLASTQFADVFAASLVGAGTSPIGLGAKVAAVAQQFTQGNISVTSNPLDMAINGGGFFRLQSATGDVVFSRNGQFQLDQNGYIVNSSGYQLTGYMADSNGNVVSTLAALRLFDPTSSSDSAPQATTTIAASYNLDSTSSVIASAFDYTDATTYNNASPIPIYDSLGNAHTLTLYFQKTSSTTWGVYGTVSNPSGASTSITDLGSLGTLTFDTDGTVLTSTVALPTISATALGYTGAVDDITATLDITGSTQYGTDFATNSVTQDGYTSGVLAGFTIGDDGTILGKYTNGQSRSLGQVVLANFRNPQGLQALGNNLWSATSISGAELDGVPGSGGQYGPLQSSALEDSNVDLTAELVSMITQQRVYQANAQTIKTQDSILQTLVNLR